MKKKQKFVQSTLSFFSNPPINTTAPATTVLRSTVPTDRSPSAQQTTETTRVNPLLFNPPSAVSNNPTAPVPLATATNPVKKPRAHILDDSDPAIISRSAPLPDYLHISPASVSGKRHLTIAEAASLASVLDFIRIFADDFGGELDPEVSETLDFLTLENALHNVKDNYKLVAAVYEKLLLDLFDERELDFVPNEPYIIPILIYDALSSLPNVNAETLNMFKKQEFETIPAHVHVQVLKILVDEMSDSDEMKECVDATIDAIASLKKEKWLRAGQRKLLDGEMIILTGEIAAQEKQISELMAQDIELENNGEEVEASSARPSITQRQESLNKSKELDVARQNRKKKILKLESALAKLNSDLSLKRRAVGEIEEEDENFQGQLNNLEAKLHSQGWEKLGMDRFCRMYWWANLCNESSKQNHPIYFILAKGTPPENQQQETEDDPDIQIISTQPKRFKWGQGFKNPVFGLVVEEMIYNQDLIQTGINWRVVESKSVAIRLLRALNTKGHRERDLRLRLVEKFAECGYNTTTRPLTKPKFHDAQNDLRPWYVKHIESYAPIHEQGRELENIIELAFGDFKKWASKLGSSYPVVISLDKEGEEKDSALELLSKNFKELSNELESLEKEQPSPSLSEADQDKRNVQAKALLDILIQKPQDYNVLVPYLREWSNTFPDISQNSKSRLCDGSEFTTKSMILHWLILSLRETRAKKLALQKQQKKKQQQKKTQLRSVPSSPQQQKKTQLRSVPSSPSEVPEKSLVVGRRLRTRSSKKAREPSPPPPAVGRSTRNSKSTWESEDRTCRLQARGNKPISFDDDEEEEEEEESCSEEEVIRKSSRRKIDDKPRNSRKSSSSSEPSEEAEEEDDDESVAEISIRRSGRRTTRNSSNTRNISTRTRSRLAPPVDEEEESDDVIGTTLRKRTRNTGKRNSDSEDEWDSDGEIRMKKKKIVLSDDEEEEEEVISEQTSEKIASEGGSEEMELDEEITVGENSEVVI